jgi:two-component system NtrC family sensor kinase
LESTTSNILIVDDDPKILEMLGAFLEQEGYRVCSASTGEEAAALPGLGEVNLALIDLRLPGQVDGHALVRDFNQRFPRMMKIIMSGMGDLDDAIAGIDEHIFAYLKKPFPSLREVRIIVQRALEQGQLERENIAYHERLAKLNRELEKTVDERSAEAIRYRDTVSYLFRISSSIATLDTVDRMLESICQALVDAGLFKRAVLLTADEGFLINFVGGAAAEESREALTRELSALRGTPLRPYEFQTAARVIGGALYVPRQPQSEMSTGTDADAWRPGDRLFFPFRRRDGRVFGFLSVSEPRDGRVPGEETIQMLHLLLSHAALHIESHEMKQQLMQHASTLERRILERTQELEESQEKFSRLVNCTSDIVYIAGEKGTVVYLNEAFRKTLGYDREDYVGRPLVSLFRELCTDNPLNRRARNSAESPEEAEGLMTVELVTRDGDKVLFEINRTPIYHAGRFRGSQGIARDVTERRALLQRLVNAERLAATGRLATGVAHEINNPLQAITSHLSVVNSKVGAESLARPNLNMIHEGIDRIRDIVRQMLDVHRPSLRQRTPTDLNRVLEEVFALTESQMEKAGVTVKTELAGDLPSVEGDPQEFYQVFLNLVLNAQEAMPNGGTLTTRTFASGTSVVCEIADSGVGIPAEHLETIFEPFFTYRASGDGTGLGLYLVRNIIQKYDGSIEAESRVGVGTTFRIKFPIAPASS